MNRKYNQLKVYYFSGTGNAKNCASWICETAERLGIKSEMSDISKTESGEIISPDEGTLTGFCSPTHGFHFPEITRKFIRRFPLSTSSGADVFVLNTRAGVRIFNIVLPGLSGVLHYLSALTLILKGYRIAGLFPVDLPSNWISLHPAIGPAGTDIIYGKQKARVERFAEKILTSKPVYRALYDFIQDLLISPAAIAYLLFGRFFLSKSYIASKNCTRCMRCLKECPVKAITLVDGRMFWTAECESCMHCMNICPEKAIETPHGFLILFFYLISAVFSASMTYLISVSGMALHFQEINNEFVQLIILSAVALPLYFSAYRILHFLMRFSLIERLVTLTSLTRLKFWGRYKAPEKF